MPYSSFLSPGELNLQGRFFSNLRFKSRIWFGLSSTLWQLWSVASGHPLPAPEDIQLVLEGYPRSGNTFLEHMLRIMCPRLTWISHTHARGTLFWSKKHSIPVLLIFREPVDATLSLFIYHGRRVSLENCLKRWILFHQTSLTHPECSFLDFDQLRDHTEAALRASLLALPGIGDYIDESLPANPIESFIYTHDRDMTHLRNVRGIHFGNEQSNKPNKQRELAKERILAAPGFIRLAPLWEEAARLHQELLRRCPSPYA
jgi:hypothetical protein